MKNKIAPPFRQAEFEILYGKGIFRNGEILDLGSQLGILEKSGSWFSYGKDRIGQGRRLAAEYLESRPEVAAEIEQKIRERALPKTTIRVHDVIEASEASEETS